MNIMPARIIWFPNKIVDVVEDKLKIDWEQDHLTNVTKYIKEDGLLFPGVIKNDEIHCGHYRLKVAKELGYDGIPMYKAETFKEVLYLTKFCELCYKHYIELKELKKIYPVNNYL